MERSSHVAKIAHGHGRPRRAGGCRRRAARAGTNRADAAPTNSRTAPAAPRAPAAHRGQSAAAALPPLRRLVRPAIPTERDRALPGTALLVGARLSAAAWLSPKLDFGLFMRRERVHFPFGSRYGAEFLYC